MNLEIQTPKWALPLLQKSRYKGAAGGRSSGKSHFFAERLVENHIVNPAFCSICIREIQKSLKFSAKKLIEDKIRSFGVEHLFKITMNEIKRIGGDGIIIFQGMQDHTADSIMSLEGFDLAWVEQAENLSARSLELLIPTIRKDGSELWFSWNPNQDTDPVDNLLVNNKDDRSIVVHVNFQNNPFCPQVIMDEAEAWRKRDPESYEHIWMGAYNSKADDQVLSGKYSIDEFETEENWDGPYYGADWGFSVDPNTLIECFIHNNILYINQEIYGNQIEIIDTPAFFDKIPTAKDYTVYADSARPEVISHMQNHGYRLVKAVEKWQGSVEDGISTLRGFEHIIIHPDCEHTAEEARLWKYKRDRLTNDVLPVLIDKHNHCWDAIRYAISPLIKHEPGGFFDL